MTEAEASEDDISLFTVGTVLLRHRRRIALWMIVGALIGFASVWAKPRLYVASASFFPQGQTDAARSGLAGLAGQLGVSVANTNQSLSPEFYVMLLQSRAVLVPLAYDTLTVAEMGHRRMAFFDLFQIGKSSATDREERSVNVLRGLISTSVVKTTGVVELHVATLWPSVSLQIANALVNGVDAYNQKTRQGQATAERKFVEGRLAVAAANLRASEDAFQRFLNTNREIGSSPQLIFERDRLQRDLNFQQQVYGSLLQAYEDVRIREVRDTPVITVIEAPSVGNNPVGRGARVRVFLGLGIGAFVGVLLALLAGIVARHRQEGSADANEFLSAVAELKTDLLRPVRWLRRRAQA